MKNNISKIEKILLYDIDENGYIKGCLINKAAIYIYLRKDDGSLYVGSSIQVANRLSSHRSRVITWGKDNYKNGSPIFYNSVLKYGWHNFNFGILEYIDLSGVTSIDKKKLLEKEQYYLDIIKPSLNLCKIAGSPLGVKRGLLFAKNVSESKKGKKQIKLNIKTNIPNNIITSDTRLKLSSRASGVIVKIFDSSNNFIKEFPNMACAAKHLGVTDRTIGRIFKTGISYDNLIYKFKVKEGYPIIVTNNENNSIKEYYSIRTLSKDIQVSRETISKNINTNKLLKGIYSITRK
jgi:group I intron endonuclease